MNTCIDYSVTWGEIVSRMQEKYGLAPDSEEKFSFGDLSGKMNAIWDDYFEELYILYDNTEE